MRKKLLVFSCFCVMCLIINCKNVQADELESNQDEYIHQQKEKYIDFETIQQALDKINVAQGEEKISFKQLFSDIISNKQKFDILSFVKISINIVFGEILNNYKLMIQIIVITIIIGIFSNFNSSFNNKYVSEMGFYVAYLLVAYIVIQTFQLISNVATDAINNITTFMQALVPSFFTVVIISGNVNSMLIYYQITLIVINVINNIILVYMLPVINIIVVLEIVNNMNEEKLLVKLNELFKAGVSWSLKILLIIFSGLNILQSLSVTAIDSFANKSIGNAFNMVPVIGSTLDGVKDTVLGSTMIIKNAVGIGGIIILLIICFVPILKILAFIIIYKSVAAIIQPISNDRVVECLNGVGDATKLFLGAVCSVALLFIIGLAIVIFATNISYMSS